MKIFTIKLILIISILVTNNAFSATENWLASSVISNARERVPNAFYYWSGNSEDLWNNIQSISARTVCYGKDDNGQDVWVATGHKNTFVYILQYSLDGKTWRDVIHHGTSGVFLDAAYGYDANNRGLWVAIGSHIIVYSDNGKDWYNAKFPNQPMLHAISYGNHKWIAVGEEGAIYTSVDGINWEDHSWGNDNYSVIGYGKLGEQPGWIIGSDKYPAHFYSSIDGINWNRNINDLVFDQSTIKFANGRWMAASYAGIETSTDGKNWEPIKFGRGYNAIFGVGHGKNQNGQGIWLAFWNDNLYELKDGAATWKQVPFQRADKKPSFLSIVSKELPDRCS